MIRKYRIHIIMFLAMLVLVIANRWVMIYSPRDQYGIVDEIYKIFNPIISVIIIALRVAALFLCLEARKVLIEATKFEESKTIKILNIVNFLVNILFLCIVASTFTDININTILNNYIYAVIVCSVAVIFILINIFNEYVLYKRLELSKTECYRIIENLNQDIKI